MRDSSSKTLLWLACLLALPLALAFAPLQHLVTFAYHTGEQSYILLMPVLCGGLIYRDRQTIFRDHRPAFCRIAVVMYAVAVALIVGAYLATSGSEWQMVLTALGIVVAWSAGFVVVFGEAAARAALFPLAMLLWMVPMPAFCVEWVTVTLQKASTEVVDLLFQLTPVPVLREGFVFQLPGQAIEVAKECSGIRSSLSTVILTLVIAHESLRANWRRAVLVAATLPIVVLKNGVRIVTLTLLAIYVDPSFLSGSLHRDGGILFFLLGLVMLLPILALLRRGDDAPAPVAEPVRMASAGTD
jgi:exosortase